MPTTPDTFMARLPFAEVYRVGGSVRDEILGRRSKDSDYVVRNTGVGVLDTVLRQAGADTSPLRLRGNGPQIGVRAHVRGLGLLEVALPRTERSTGGGRHDFEIHVDPSIELAEDAVRRDFTMNALYLDVRSQRLLDPTGMGHAALMAHKIETTHPQSFADDPLRILRALRFMATLPDFTLGSATAYQMTLHAAAVTGLTQRGVSSTALDELSRLLMGGRPGPALRVARDAGVLATLLPELEPMLNYEQRSRYHSKNTDEHTFDAIQAAARMGDHAPLRVRLALLFHDAGKPKMAWRDEQGNEHYYALNAKRAVELDAPAAALEPHEVWGAKLADESLRRLNAPRRLRDDVVTLVERHMLPIHENIRPFKVRQWRAELGDDLLKDLIVHRVADTLGKGGDTSEAMEVLAWIEEQRERAQRDGVPHNAKELAITGREIMEAAAVSGRQVGVIQRQLLHEVLANPKLNEREWLLSRAPNLKGFTP